jgi:hypothetical protein
MRKVLVGFGLFAVLASAVPIVAQAEGVDPNGKATFLGPIQTSGNKATLKVRYQCASGTALWVSAKQTKSGLAAAKLTKEGSSKVSAAWLESHRNKFICNGKMHTGTFSIDTVEKGSKGTLKAGSAWVQFCVTKGKTEATTVLILSKSAWVKVA